MGGSPKFRIQIFKKYVGKYFDILKIMQDFNVWKALLCEFLGTFTLVLIGAGAVALTVAQGGSLVGSAFAFGLVLMTLFYTWGSFSGAHFNPAVSFGFAVAGRMPWGLMFAYWIAQFLGGIAAAALIAYFYGTSSGVGASVGSLTNTDQWKAFLVEAFLTFFLVITILFVTRNPYMAIAAGLAIGLVLTFDMLAGAPLTGGSMNPARSLGPAIFSNNMGSYWIYILGPLVGALVAALIYKLFVTDFSCCPKLDACGNRVTDECGNCLKECQRQVVDECGRPVKDCNGCPVMETYTTREKKEGFMQNNFWNAIGHWMSERGANPQFIKQEYDRAVDHAKSSPPVEAAAPAPTLPANANWNLPPTRSQMPSFREKEIEVEAEMDLDTGKIQVMAVKEVELMSTAGSPGLAMMERYSSYPGSYNVSSLSSLAP